MKEGIKHGISIVCLLLGLYTLVIYKVGLEPLQGGLQIWRRSNCTTENRQFIENSFLIEKLRTFPWSKYEQGLREKNESSFVEFSSQLLAQLLPFFVMPPKVNVNGSCKPSVLTFPPHAPKCRPLSRPRKVGVLVQFGFEADILEIYLHELADIVDYFFILESTRSQFLGIKKPLIWEQLKNQERFKNFVNRTVHLLLDDTDTIYEAFQSKASILDDGKRFGIEGVQERARWFKFMEWNSVAKYFQGDDILGFGDVDEIPNRDVIFYLKHCESPSDPVDIGIWFPFGKIGQVFQTDWPVKGHPFTLGDPTFWTLKTALSIDPKHPTRQRGKSSGFLLGGMHMTHYGYLPVRLADYFTASESNANNFLKLVPQLQNLNKTSLRSLEQELSVVPSVFKNRIMSTQVFQSQFPLEFQRIVYLPWFYNCNRKRYPVWEGNHDTRLE